MRMRILISLLITAALPLAADELPARLEQRPARAERHYIVETQHVLQPAEMAALAAQGVAVQRALPGNRYIVRMAPNAIGADDPRVRSVEAFNASRKIARAALRAAASGPFARLQVIFQDDVTFDEAASAIAEAGGVLDQPLTVSFSFPRRLIVRMPTVNLGTLAADDRVFAVYGPPLKPGPLNQQSAIASHVTTVNSAPYNLDGSGVELSSGELGEAETAHPEFQGRATSHFGSDKGVNDDQRHATHTGGTMIAAGINNAEAKGMAPAAKLELLDVRLDSILDDKAALNKNFGVVADNNSWGYQLGWQFDANTGRYAWFDNIDYFGGYDGQVAAPFDHVALSNGTLLVFSAGNDASSGNPLVGPNFVHEHVSDTTGDIIPGKTFCYSANGSGTDCPTTLCNGGCETTKHDTYTAFTTIGITASAKDVVSVGAIDANHNIASFSSRGPARDGRVKPELVAVGINTLSTVPIDSYAGLSGTSMSAPVVTGIAGLLTQQWRKTFNGANPTPQQLKTVLIAGADDIGNPGPDYTYGFGLANAQTSADLIIADGGNGARIHSDSVVQGQTADIPMTVGGAQNVRVVLGWADPEVLLQPDQLADKALLNDLDLKVTDPSGNAILPYILDVNNPSANATHGVNTADNVEEVEIPNAAPGNYHILVSGSHVTTPNQSYVVVANVPLQAQPTLCGDPYEPNDTAATAYGNLAPNQTITAKSCSQNDLDFYKFVVSFSGPVTVTLTATDTPLRLTLTGSGNPQTVDVPAGQTRSLSVTLGSGVKQPVAPVTFLVEVQPTAAPGASAMYKLTPSYSTVVPVRERAARH